jgi:outer membrane protein assembly factor BamB
MSHCWGTLSIALLVTLSPCHLVTLSHAGDVPQFRGVGGLGVADARGLPLTWSDKENLRWKAELPGRGLSGPVIAGGRIYITACSGFNQTRLHTLCFEQSTGKKVWERQLWATGGTLCHPKTNMAAPTPVTDGEHVYVLFATGDLVCYSREGDLLWYRSLVGDYPTVGNNVGMAASPVLAGDVLVVCLENIGESFAAGIDRRSGQNRWRVERPRGINWVTPLVIQNRGQTEVLLQGPEELTAYDVASGQKRWALTDQRLSTIPSPTVGAGTIYVPGEKFLAVRPGSPTEAPSVLWQSLKLKTSYGSPLYEKGRVYTVSFKGIVNAAEAATGKVIWTCRLEGDFAASPLLADGRLYLVNEEGTTTVLRDSGGEYEVLGTNALKDTILASPVASGDALFLRSDGYLYCIGEKKE